MTCSRSRSKSRFRSRPTCRSLRAPWPRSKASRCSGTLNTRWLRRRTPLWCARCCATTAAPRLQCCATSCLTAAARSRRRACRRCSTRRLATWQMCKAASWTSMRCRTRAPHCRTQLPSCFPRCAHICTRYWVTRHRAAQSGLQWCRLTRSFRYRAQPCPDLRTCTARMACKPRYVHVLHSRQRCAGGSRPAADARQ